MIISGAKNWSKRFEAFESQIKSNPFYEEYILDRFPLEIAFQSFQNWKRSTGREHRVPIDAEEAALFGFIGMAARVHQRLSEKGKKRLEGSIRDALKNDDGLSPVAFELAIAAHMMHRDFDVEFVDLEGKEKFDLLCEREGRLLEVECKNLSGDAGRPIHRRRLVQLGAAIQGVVGTDRRRKAGIELVRVTLDKRLEGRTEHQNAIASAVARSLQTQEDIRSPEGFSIDYELIGPEKSPEIPSDINSDTVARLRGDVENLVQSPNANIVFDISPGRSVTAVVVDSLKRTKIMDYVAEQSKKAASGQLTGKQPGMVCIRFVDISDQQLYQIAEVEKSSDPSALQLVASELLSREDWGHIHTLAFFARGDATISRHVSGLPGHFTSSFGGSVYHFKNKSAQVGSLADVSLF